MRLSEDVFEIAAFNVILFLVLQLNFRDVKSLGQWAGSLLSKYVLKYLLFVLCVIFVFIQT